MRYHILSKIVGPYLPEELSFGDLSLRREFCFDVPDYPTFPVMNLSSEEHLIKKGVECRIGFLSEKINLRSFSSSHLIRVITEAQSPYQAKQKALLRIEHLVESLTVASFGKEKIRVGKLRDRGINDFYQYEFLGVYVEDQGSLHRIKVSFLTSGTNFFPELMEDDLKILTKNVLVCSSSVVIKSLKYLKRAREFSYEHFSEMEVFLNSMKCIELICLSFYPKGTKKTTTKGRQIEMSFLDKLNGIDDKKGVIEIMEIEAKYGNLAGVAWGVRNSYDYAHASEFDNVIPPIHSQKVNEAAYHFVFIYILYLKQNDADCFWNDAVLKKDDWWVIFS